MILNGLSELRKESISRGIPIIDEEKGAWLLEQIKKHNPKKILELGTANGYSGCILGSQNGELITIEIDPKIAQEASVNLSKFKINYQIIIGDAIKITAELARKQPASFNLIFIDFIKKGYLPVLENCISLVKKGGIIIADNITMKGCQDFKEAVLSHPVLRTEIINIKDGLSYSIVKATNPR